MKISNPIKSGIWILLVMFIVIGCSSNSTSSGKTSSGNGKTIQLTMQAWGNPAELKVYQKAIDGFMDENPNIKVKLVPVSSDQYDQKLMTSLQGSKGPDVFYAHEPTMPQMIEADVVQPLDDFFNSAASYVNLKEFPEGLFGPARQEGITYGVAPDANPMVIYYNKTIFKEAGLKTPQEYYEEGNWNWDTFIEVTSKIKESGKEGLIMENWQGHWYSWIWSNGGRIFDEEGNFVLPENEKAKETFHFLHDLVSNGNAVYAGSLPQGQGVDAMFMSNQVGMVAGGRWFTPQFDQNPSLDYDYIYFPSNTKEKQEMVSVPVAYMSVNKKSEHLEEAMKFVSYYVGKEGQEARTGKDGNALPSLPSADENALEGSSEKHMEYLFDGRNNGFTHGSNFARDAQFAGLTTEISETIDLMFLGKEDADTTIDKVIKIINQYVDK